MSTVFLTDLFVVPKRGAKPTRVIEAYTPEQLGVNEDTEDEKIAKKIRKALTEKHYSTLAWRVTRVTEKEIVQRRGGETKRVTTTTSSTVKPFNRHETVVWLEQAGFINRSDNKAA